MGGKNDTKHGYSHHPLYRVWAGIKQRCKRLNDIKNQSYILKGIKMCPEWKDNPKSFIEWALNHGWKPGLSIERIDNYGHYCPENCTFATPLQQAQNRDRPTSYGDIPGLTIGIKKMRGGFQVRGQNKKVRRGLGTFKTLEGATGARQNFLQNISKDPNYLPEEWIKKSRLPKGIVKSGSWYQVYFNHNGKNNYISSHKTVEEAVIKRDGIVDAITNDPNFVLPLCEKTSKLPKNINKNGPGFSVTITINKKTYRLGTFKTVDEAISVKNEFLTQIEIQN